MPETITREQLNEAINEFADKIMEALGATVAGEETNKPEPTGTRFKAIDTNGEEVEMDAVDIVPGTLLTVGLIEYFRCRSSREGDWMSFLGEWYTNEEFAEKVRNHSSLPTVVHWG